MLIPGPKSPRQNIDVYLPSLIDELYDLWVNGIETWDAKEKRISSCMRSLYRQLMTFLHAQCSLVGAQKASLHVHIVTRILSIYG
jgi:hypothetical protein